MDQDIEIIELMQSLKALRDAETATALRFGQFLIEVRDRKKAAGERDFKKWVKKNCPFSYFQATKLIRLAAHRASIANFPKTLKDFDALGLMAAYVAAGVSKAR